MMKELSDQYKIKKKETITGTEAEREKKAMQMIMEDMSVDELSQEHL